MQDEALNDGRGRQTGAPGEAMHFKSGHGRFTGAGYVSWTVTNDGMDIFFGLRQALVRQTTGVEDST